MAVRQFDGSDDRVVVAAGAVTSDGGPLTIAILWKPAVDNAGQGIIQAHDNAGAGDAWHVNPFNTGLFFGTDGGFGSITFAAADGWRLDVFTKATGLAAARGHSYVYSSPGWTHVGLLSFDDSTLTGAITQVTIGECFGTDNLNGRLAAVAVWNSVLSDGQVETLESALADWLALNPAALWSFDQASTATPVEDLTGNGADQTAISGTTVVTGDDPPGFSFALGANTGTLSASLPALVGDLTGAAVSRGDLATSLPALVADLNGAARASGVLAASLPALTADLGSPPAAPPESAAVSLLVAQGRAAAERLMADQCTIVEVTGVTTDPVSGRITETTAQVYVGKCRVQQASANPREATVGDANLLMLTRVLQLPVAASTGVRAGHRVTITACQLDPGLVGRLFAVRGEFAKTHATSRRLAIEEKTS